jgi:hypothetical protein
LAELSREILARWPGEALSESDANTVWSDLLEFRWTHSNGVLAKIALTPNSWPPLEQELSRLDGQVEILHGGVGAEYLVDPLKPDLAEHYFTAPPKLKAPLK